jgi:hypothetical protein
MDVYFLINVESPLHQFYISIMNERETQLVHYCIWMGGRGCFVLDVSVILPTPDCRVINLSPAKCILCIMYFDIVNYSFLFARGIISV